ncbi:MULTISPECIES: hypothetical protein [Enterococcus]|uniref:Uncharacterized protein n=1 Tax=Candidatus Enterococcus ferrettii TaxID=2815324 RepID=A0ABV0EMI6_9ENTE|nr:hypothetical protein [Enterococcus sp. 665A]MBO1341632.1 hypothetical protein [Enterococcus sp. 665A]
MVLEYFDGQENFFNDYKKAVKEEDFDEQTVIDDVMAQLSLPAEDGRLSYTLSGSKTKSSRPSSFPFRKELVARDPEATVDTLYFYEGEPYEFDLQEDEQP